MATVKAKPGPFSRSGKLLIGWVEPGLTECDLRVNCSF
jgi:hypothetical protein